ncbi:hypothetical protein [Calothrix sp. PCC 7507]|uniref:hypothetical protein n=1 Tax=Calothrix sp. PCC 7507 TaxID=99598 RepID=UPI00029F1EC7|nr:hypothetical protein [Calothrix sp. PCC 7507]AFY32266.1 hypothetical protein Cal7507_1811 [Calothrix sp. PCC 7507]
MNIQLVESLANAIKALSIEERELLNQKLISQSNWQTLRPKVLANAQAMQQRRSGQSFEPDVDQIIHQMREERDQQLLVDLFPRQEQL